MTDGTTRERPPVVWRLPPWQPAVLFLVTAAFAGWSIYASSSPPVRAITIGLAVAFFVAAVAAARMYLVADDEGIGVRRYAGETAVSWDQVTGIAVTRLRGGSLTLEVQCRDAATLTVPPSLVLPGRPTSIARTQVLLSARARDLEARRPVGR